MFLSLCIQKGLPVATRDEYCWLYECFHCVLFGGSRVIISRLKILDSAMKGASCVRRVRLRSWFLVSLLWKMFVPLCARSLRYTALLEDMGRQNLKARSGHVYFVCVNRIGMETIIFVMAAWMFAWGFLWRNLGPKKKISLDVMCWEGAACGRSMR